MVLDLTVAPDISTLLQGIWCFKVDRWDGYRTERREVLEAVADAPWPVVLAVDLRGSNASELRAPLARSWGTPRPSSCSRPQLPHR